MPNIGPMELIFLGLLAVLIFGPKKLPEIGRSLGRATRDFKDSISGTGISEAVSGVNDVRTAMTPTNLAKAAMPASVKEMQADVTEMKQTFTDPLGQKKDETPEAKAEGDTALAAAAEKPEAPVA